MNIDWNANSSQILINPCYSIEEQSWFNRILDYSSSWPNHLWMSTSGSTAAKWVGLSKDAIFISAQAINDHLCSYSKDIWIHALPDFHVGGLGIWARSFLSGAQVRDFKADVTKKWDAFAFHQYVCNRKGTLTALVPTQLHDLIHARLESPPSLRAVIVGGGSLSSEMYLRGVQLGWKILPSYGMTECASQVATAELGSWENVEFPRLKLLPHMQADVQEEGRIRLKSHSLLSVYAMFSGDLIEFVDPKKEGWLLTEDRGSIQGDAISVFGRLDEMIKVGGENVDLTKLEAILQEIRLALIPSLDMTLLAIPDERLGCVINLVVANASEEVVKPIVDMFQQRVLPFERIRAIRCVKEIPRTPLSKVLRAQLLKLI